MNEPDLLSRADAKQALQRLDAEPPVKQDPLAVLERAVASGASMEVVSRMMEVRRELMAEAARKAYFDALAAFQAECPIITRNRAGHESRYNYAPLETIVKIVTPFLTKHGFSHQEDGIVTEGWVEAVVSVTHREGHKEEKRFKVPSNTNAGMSPQQKYGAAMTYATRYAFCAAFGIRTADKDTDCPPSDESVTKLKSDLWALVKPIRGMENNWNIARQWLTDECNMDPGKRVSDLNAEELKELIIRASELLPGGER